MLKISDFQYDPQSHWYTSTAVINGNSSEIYISDEQTKEIQILTKVANAGIAWVEENFESIKAYCSENLLELKNESWVESDEEKVTEDEFKERLLLESIKIESNGSLELSFEDGDLFYGHWIIVKTDADRKLVYADIEG